MPGLRQAQHSGYLSARKTATFVVVAAPGRSGKARGGGKKSNEPTLLTLCVIDTKAEQRRPLAPQRGDITGEQVQLEDRRVHVLRPKYEIVVMRDSEWMVELLPVVDHLRRNQN